VSLSSQIVVAEPSTVVVTGTGTQIARRGVSFDGDEVVLVASACTACDAVAWPPAARCHACWGAVTPRRLATSGTLYAFTTVHTASPGTEVPYVIGYVDLPDGVRVFTPLRGDTSRLRIDGPVTLHGAADASGAGFWFEAAR
jgi:uncharacterized OB-fold protein